MTYTGPLRASTADPKVVDRATVREAHAAADA
jgi:hypothetical protein